MQSLSVRVLGEFEVDGVEPYALGSRKGRALLRLLALARGQSVSADALASALWGDALPSKPADQVAVLVSRLRGVVGGDRLEHTDAGYRLHYDWLDADELADLVAEIERRQLFGNVGGAAAAARVALSLVHGELVVEQEPWAEARRVELDRLVTRARRLAVSALSAAGHWVEAGDIASAAVQRDPYDEDALRLLMRAYVGGGRVGSALSAYAKARETLADDLGADPSPETDSLHQAILRGELAATDPALTSAVPRLVGRADEMDRLDMLAVRARGGSFEFVVVEGEAGIGKTSLLQAWSARRAAVGDIVLAATFGSLDRAVPLDGLLAAIGAHLRAAGPERTAEVLGTDAALLAPMLSLADGSPLPPALSDGVMGPSVLFAGVLRLLRRLSQHAPLVVVLDDVHRAGPVLAEWLEFVRRRGPAMVVAAGVRSGEGTSLPSGERIELGPLDRAAAAALVGVGAADQLYEMSGGHPLFLVELAVTPDATTLPTSLVEVVSTRCDELGPAAAATLRSAAVIGSRLDLDLLAAVLHRPVIDLLGDVEQAVARRLVVDEGAGFWFRHELVRAALSASATDGRRALLHREVSRVLRRRMDADPIDVAEHARLGGDVVLAAQSLRAAATRASQRFDHATAEGLLDDAVQLHADADTWLQRARVRTLRGRYTAAYEDVERAAPAGAAALEVGAWASYFDRRFEQAVRFAQDGELLAEDPAVRARCLIVGGRTRHAAGDLVGAQRMLVAAVGLARGTDLLTASAWLGVLRAHQSRVEDALRLLSPAARSNAGVEHTSATLHALLFTGHAHALAGRPFAALDCFARYTDEVERRHVPRFAGRGVNFAGWVLRNVGAVDEGVERHQEALEVANRNGTPEVTIAALEDLAEERLGAGDLEAAAGRLMEAQSHLRGDLVFGWRLELKLRLLQGRFALANGDSEQALAIAEALAARAVEIGVPRYTSVARLLGHRARARLGMPVDLAAAEADLDLLDRSVAVEAWWWTGEMAADLRVPGWVDRAADSAARLARAAGERGAALGLSAGQRLDIWKAAAG
jgi:DNA-binding SARP family transcriptional activator/tetratricopeptide (TPR) repeat protein